MNVINQNSQNQTSIFHDREEGPFQNWMQLEGLDPNASDDIVIDAMNAYFEKHNTAQIYPHVSQIGSHQNSHN